MGDALLRAVIIALLGAGLFSGVLPDVPVSAAVAWHGASLAAHAALAWVVAKILHAEPDGLLAAVLIVSLAAMGFEISQPLWGRSSDFVDYLSNVIGVAMGALIIHWRRQAATAQ